VTQKLRIALAQLNFLVGDIAGNTVRIREAVARARVEGAQVVVFPELCLTGYPPEDLLLRPGLMRQVDSAVNDLRSCSMGMYVVIGCPQRVNGELFNCALVLHDGVDVACYRKQQLPNYSVFDEKRYFSIGQEASIFDVNGIRLGLSVCEDIWFPGPSAQAVEHGAQLILNLNASPFHQGKMEQREAVVAKRAQEGRGPVVYVNLIGGQDELVFDGASFVVDARGTVVHRAASFEESISLVEFELTPHGLSSTQSVSTDRPDNLAAVYDALVLGLRDYVRKNGFKGVVLGLSGGIDSALTMAIAVDALGAPNVEAVMLPSRYTADISEWDAADMAKRLGVTYRSISIEKAFAAFTELLADEFAGAAADVTEENIQARCRGVILMAISNKKGRMVLSTGNKSEMAVGYSTLYGDMAGGLDVLKDVPKTLVYDLSNYRNRQHEVIPQRIIDRPPSAELRPDQKDSDSLPDYALLDPILEAYVERDMSVADIVAMGFDQQEVIRVTRMVDRNEYKRRQAAPGIRITPRAFGKDRRYPITSGFRD